MKNRVSRLKYLTTPLVFFGLALITLESIFIAIFVKCEIANQQASTYFFIMIGLFILIILIVSIFAWRIPENLIFDPESHLRHEEMQKLKKENSAIALNYIAGMVFKHFKDIIQDKKGLLYGLDYMLIDAQKMDNNYIETYLNRGRIKRALAFLEGTTSEEKVKLLHDAINILDDIISLNDTYDSAYYNRACYKCLLGYNATAVLKDLKKGIELDQSNSDYARTDPDFESIKDLPDFLKLTL